MTRPSWIDRAKLRRVWCEDDATYMLEDHEDLRDAWRRLYGEPYPGKKAAVEVFDGGDCDWILYPGGRVALSSFPGNSEIYEVVS